MRRISSDSDLKGCEVVYIAASESRKADDLIKEAANQPILTVGEGDNFIERGGIIRFVRSGGRIHFQINPDAAVRASLRVSSEIASSGGRSVRPDAGARGIE